MSTDDIFYAEVVGEDRVRNFDRLPVIAQTIIIKKVTEYTEKMAELAGDLLEERLGTKSGKLNASAIETDVKVEGGRVKGRAFISGIPYARIQEEGGVTSAHMIYPNKGRLLAFIGSMGDKVFATRVFHPGGAIPGKFFMRDARRQMGPQISKGLKQAIVQGIRENMRGGFS